MYHQKLEQKVQQRTQPPDQEIIEHKQKVEDLLHYEVIVSSTNDQLALVNPQFHYTLVNNAYSRRFNKPTEEIIGMHVADLLGQEVFENTIKPMLEKCLNGKEVNYQSWFTFPALGKRFMDVSYIPYFDKDKNIKGAIVRIHDMTEMKSLNEQLLQAQKMELVGQLAGGIAHDFNNALAIIINSAEISKMELSPGSPVHHFLDHILEAAAHSTNITRQLLTFAKKQAITPRIISINETIDNTLSMLKRLISEDIQLVWKPGSDIWNIKIDPVQIEQVLTNLCINAQDAIIGNGQIIISTKNIELDQECCTNKPDLKPGKYVLLTVSDDGQGMNELEMENIFEPFFSTKAIGQGTGLGLASVYGIVQQNNGFINVSSIIGKGSTFEIYFHSHSGNVLKNKPVPATIPKGQRDETILLVEDDKAILELGPKILENLGYTVISVANPLDAIELVKSDKPDINLLITDVVMPDMDGQELSKILKTLIPEIRVLFMSGYTASVIEDKGILKEGVNFIQKPFHLKDIAIAARKALDE